MNYTARAIIIGRKIRNLRRAFRAFVRTSPSINAKDKKDLFRQIDMLAVLQKQLLSLKEKTVENKLNNVKDETRLYDDAKKDLDSLFNDIYDYLTQACRKSGDEKLEDRFYNLLLVNRNKSKTPAEIDSLWKEVKSLIDSGFRVTSSLRKRNISLSYSASLKVLSE